MPVPQSFKATILETPKTEPIIKDRSLPELKSGEIAIKVNATAINPVDWKIRDTGEFVREYPTVLGTDAAGVVAAVGPDVSDFAVGERVFFQGIFGMNTSTFQQYTTLPAVLVGKTPENISDVEAAGVSLATIAALTAIYDKHTGRGLPAPWDKGGDVAGKGKAIVVVGGSSSVGQYGIQLARLSGFDKIITNASTANHEFLKRIGATHVLDRNHSRPEDFAEIIGDTPLDMVFDPIGLEETQVLSMRIHQAAKNSGTHVATVLTKESKTISTAGLAIGDTLTPKATIVQILGVGSLPGLRYLSEPLMRELGGPEGYLAKGAYIPNRPRVVPGGLGALQEALELNKKGVSGEKVIIRPNEE